MSRPVRDAIGNRWVRRVAVATMLLAVLVLLVQRTDDVPPPAVRAIGEYSSENIDTPASQVTAVWDGYGPGWPDGHGHAFSGYHLLKIEDGDVVPAVSVDHSHPFDPKVSQYSARWNPGIQQAEAVLWLVLWAGYEADVPPDTDSEAAVAQMAVWRLTDNLRTTEKDLSKEHLDAEENLPGLVDGLVKVTQERNDEHPTLPPASFSITGASERTQGNVQLIGILSADRNPMPDQPLTFNYPGGSVIALTNDEGEAAVSVPVLDEKTFRARISWKGLVKAGTIFECRCSAKRRSQTLMTIRDAVIERSVLLSIRKADVQ